MSYDAKADTRSRVLAAQFHFLADRLDRLTPIQYASIGDDLQNLVVMLELVIIRATEPPTV
jgi:hypothetical protein